MKQSSVFSPRCRAARTDAAQRPQLLAGPQRIVRRRFWPPARCSLHHLLRLAAPPSELVIEMSAARLRLVCPAQLPLAARLLQILQEGWRC